MIVRRTTVTREWARAQRTAADSVTISATVVRIVALAHGASDSVAVSDVSRTRVAASDSVSISDSA